MTRDPIGYAGGPNLYEYAASNPVNFVDDTGSRPISAKDRARLGRLYGSISTKQDITLHDVNRAVSHLKGLINGVPGRKDPPALNAIWWAIDNLGNNNYSKAGTIKSPGGTIGSGKNKCNIFVSDAYAMGAGIGTSKTNLFGIPLYGSSGHYPGANAYADQNSDMPGFRIVNLPYQTGDLLAHSGSSSGHAVLSLAPGIFIYANIASAVLGTYKLQVQHGMADWTARRRF